LAGQERPTEKISYVGSSSGSVGGCRNRRPRIAARAIHPYDESQRPSLTLARKCKSAARISPSAPVAEIYCLIPTTRNAASARVWTGFDSERPAPLGLGQAAKSPISSAPEFCTENTLIFQWLGFGKKLLIYEGRADGCNQWKVTSNYIVRLFGSQHRIRTKIALIAQVTPQAGFQNEILNVALGANRGSFEFRR
jgi:hypothetical protein